MIEHFFSLLLFYLFVCCIDWHWLCLCHCLIYIYDCRCRMEEWVEREREREIFEHVCIITKHTFTYEMSRLFVCLCVYIHINWIRLCFHSLVPLVAAIGLIGVPITGDDQANHHLECYSAAAVATATATATAAAIWPQINTILIRVVGRIDLSLLMNQERRGTPTLNKI